MIFIKIMNSHTIKILIVSIFLFILGFSIAYWRRPNITFRNQSDGFAYYLPLRSYIFDKDIDFTNENKAFENTYHAIPYYWKEKTKNGLPVYQYSIGPSLLWSPFLILGMNDYKKNLSEENVIKGFSAQELNLLTLGSYFYGSIALIFTFLFLLRLYPSMSVALTAVILSAFATPFLYYLRYQPLMSHVLSAFSVSLFLFLWILQYGKQRWYRYIYLGVICGIVSLVRWQDSIIVTVLICESIFYLIEKRAKKNFILNWILFFISASITFSPQVLFWNVLYGKLFLIPQGSSFFSCNLNNILSFLFSFQHGLITWTPTALFSIIGLGIYVWRKSNEKKLNQSLIQVTSFTIVIIVSVIINGSLVDWHGSDSFGARRMTSVFPLFALGIYLLILMSKDRLIAFLVSCFIILAVYNSLFADIFYLQKVDHYSAIYPSDAIQSIREQYRSN